jgi:hypothetical protein
MGIINETIQIRNQQVDEAAGRVQAQVDRGHEIAKKAEESVKESRDATTPPKPKS